MQSPSRYRYRYNGFNNVLAKVGHSFARRIPPSQERPIDGITGCFPTLGSFDSCTCTEVLEMINGLKNSAAGHHEIEAKIMKEVGS